MQKLVLKLFTGNSIGQVIQFLALLYFSVLYSPENFGQLANIQSFGSILAIFLTLQMQHVIPLAQSIEEAKKFTQNIINISFFLFCLSFVLFIFINIEYEYAILLAFFLSLSNSYNGYFIYSGDFTKISILYIIRAISIVIFQYFLFLFGVINGLLIGALIGECISVIYLISQRPDLIKYSFKFNKLKFFILDWKPFSFYGTIQEFLSVAIYALPIIFYTEKFGEAVSGQYSIAFKLIFAPTVLISSSLSQVLYNRLKEKNGFDFFKKIIWFNLKFIYLFLFFLFLFILSSRYSLNLISKEWQLCIKILPFIYINAMVFLFASPYRVALRFLRLNKLLLIIELVTLIFITILFFIESFDVILFTISITLVSVIQNILIVYQYKYNETKNQKIN